MAITSRPSHTGANRRDRRLSRAFRADRTAIATVSAVAPSRQFVPARVPRRPAAGQMEIGAWTIELPALVGPRTSHPILVVLRQLRPRVRREHVHLELAGDGALYVQF